MTKKRLVMKYKPRLTVGRLRELIKDVPDDIHVVARVAIENSAGSLRDAFVTKGRTMDEDGLSAWWGVDTDPDKRGGRDAEDCCGGATKGPVVDVLFLDDWGFDGWEEAE